MKLGNDEYPDYIVCAGVAVPADWTVEELKKILAKRQIRFRHEEELMKVFGKALLLKRSLQDQIRELEEKKAKLTALMAMKR